jgi:GNAT superfamily N-acetyltransferase
VLHFRIDRVRADHRDAEALFSEYLADLRVRTGGLDDSRQRLPHADEMTPPRGVFLVGYELAFETARPVACGGFRALAPGVAEIHRMYVLKGVRRNAHARWLLSALEAAAREMGHRRVMLDTSGPMEDETSLYITAGYRQIDRNHPNPRAACWLAKVW